jgi:hypothetical protein
MQKSILNDEGVAAAAPFVYKQDLSRSSIEKALIHLLFLDRYMFTKLVFYTYVYETMKCRVLMVKQVIQGELA